MYMYPFEFKQTCKGQHQNLQWVSVVSKTAKLGLLKNCIVMWMGGVDEIRPHNYEELCTSSNHNTSYVEAQEG